MKKTNFIIVYIVIAFINTFAFTSVDLSEATKSIFLGAGLAFLLISTAVVVTKLIELRRIKVI